MENSKVAVQLEEISIDKVCRTCLNTSSDEMASLFDYSNDELLEKLNFVELINETFGRIMPLTQNQPNRVCSDCQKIISKAFSFKKQCQNSTQILTEALDHDQSTIYGQDDKSTQTSQDPEPQFDDENFDTVNAIFDSSSQGNPLSMQVQEQVETEIVKEPEESQEDQSDAEVEQVARIFKCDICSKSFVRQSHLTRHKLLHNDEKALICSICSKEFTRLDHLNQHVLNNHSESKPFSCDIADCKKGFLKEDHLKRHIEAKHTDPPAKTKEICSICQKTFSSKKYLKTHMKSHNTSKEALKKDPNSEKPFLCSECGLRFVRNDYLVIHMRRHLGVKPYKCRFCDKGFPRATDLTVHERYHTNEKTHLCNLCGKGFQRAYNLLVHMRVHTGEKPYSCSYCSKSFSQGNDLKAHIRRHTGERFKCDLCNEGFIQGYHLRNHKKAVHGIEVKSHIRRVEKFVSPTVSENQQEVSQQLEIEHEVKLEPDVQLQFPAT